MNGKHGIPKSVVCGKCGYDVLDVVTQEGEKLRINAQMMPYEADPKGEKLYMADGTVVRGHIIWPGMEKEADGYAHRRHSVYCERPEGFRKRGKPGDFKERGKPGDSSLRSE